MGHASLGVLDKNRASSTSQKPRGKAASVHAKLVLRNNQLSEAGSNGTQLLGISFANADT